VVELKEWDNGPSRNATTEAIPITRRERIIEELVKTERDYVQHLEILQSFNNMS